MPKLEIHESLIEYVRKLTGKKELNFTLEDDRNIIEKVNAAYQDCIKLCPESVNTFKLITYNIIRNTSYDLPVLTPNTTHRYITQLLTNQDFRKKLFQINPQSEFFSVLKDLLPYYIKLEKCINNNKGYEAITLYEEIVQYLDLETLGQRKGRELEEECHKRYNIPFNTVDNYRINMNKKHYKPFKNFNIEIFNSKGFYSPTCALMANYFYSLMLEFYKSKGYMYYPISEDFSLYIFNNIGILTYKYEDDIQLEINGFSPVKFEFWALLNHDKNPKITVNTKSLRTIINFKGTLLIAPEEFREEALIKYIMHELGEKEFTPELIDVLKKLGIPEEYYAIDELSTLDYKTFFIDPRKVDRLRIKNPINYPTLMKILKKPEEEREAYYQKLYATYKGLYPEIEEEKSMREIRKENPKAWLD